MKSAAFSISTRARGLILPLTRWEEGIIPWWREEKKRKWRVRGDRIGIEIMYSKRGLTNIRMIEETQVAARMRESVD